MKGTVWVTGASAGIGRAICAELASRGWSVGAGSRTPDRLRPLEEAAASGPGSIRAAELDVRDAASIDRWVKRLR
ncbi:MAG: SDR family NAD(P)-dependent oxidoreductase, partial [Candidatus Eisenbacteria bacterium]|nr:SDR family NAD(P)-dependent oxidoreductase [Candidatus Eisenbacteria bacterium]